MSQEAGKSVWLFLMKGGFYDMQDMWSREGREAFQDVQVEGWEFDPHEDMQHLPEYARLSTSG
jgi:hypothetical protein